MTDPVSPLLGAAAGRFLGYLGGQLQQSDWSRLRASFVRALELQLAADSEVPALRTRRGRVVAAVARGAQSLGRKFKREGTREVSEERKARKQRRGPVARVAEDLVTHLQAAMSSAAGTAATEPERWSAVVQEYLELAAREGLGSEEEDRRKAWEVVVAGDRVGGWAAAVAGSLKLDWILDPSLEGFVDQLNADDEFLLTHALVTAGREVADGVRLLVFVGLPVLLLGGGAVALLVLFIDKG